MLMSELRYVKIHDINKLCGFSFDFVVSGVVSCRQLSKPWRSFPLHSQVSQVKIFSKVVSVADVSSRPNFGAALIKQTFN